MIRASGTVVLAKDRARVQCICRTFDKIFKGSWFNQVVMRTVLLLVSKSESQSYCKNIIGNTTLPYELWHLEDLKYESSLSLGIHSVEINHQYWFG